MAKIAIKHMTEEQARAESYRIHGRLEDLRREIDAIDERAERFDILARGWLKLSDRIVARLNEIANGAEVVPGETRALVEGMNVCAKRYAQRIRDRNVVWLEKDRLFREMDGLYKRSSRVTARRWQVYGPRDPDRIHVLPR